MDDEREGLEAIKRGLCPACGEKGRHYVPPALGDAGFYYCQRKLVVADEREGLRQENAELRNLLDETALDRAGIAGQLSAAEVLVVRYREALEEAQRLLGEAVGWMEGVEPRPSQPFLDACRRAALGG